MLAASLVPGLLGFTLVSYSASGECDTCLVGTGISSYSWTLTFVKRTVWFVSLIRIRFPKVERLRE